MAMKYKILVDAQLNPTQIQKQLDLLSGAKKGVGATSAAIKTQSGFWKTLGNDISSTTAKVIKFGAITQVISLAKDAVVSMVNAVIELDKVQTEYKKVSDLSGESLQKFTMQATEAGIAVGRTGKM